MEFEGKHEGSPSNSASILSNMKKFEGKREGAPSKFPANTTYMSHVFSEDSKKNLFSCYKEKQINNYLI
jgi:hypothetical protein